jgi:hypothetical protein
MQQLGNLQNWLAKLLKGLSVENSRDPKWYQLIDIPFRMFC